MNKNKEKMQISSSRALLIFIATTIVLEVIIYFIQAILLKYTNISNTFYKWYETIYKINEYLLFFKCLINIIIISIIILVFILLLKKFFTFNNSEKQKFLKNAIILHLCLCVFIVLGNVYIGNNKLYTEIHTLEVVETIHIQEYNENSENFKGVGIAENCTTLDEVRDVVANEKKERIYNYFVEPIVTNCVNLITVVVCLEGFTRVFFREEAEDVNI